MLMPLILRPRPEQRQEHLGAYEKLLIIIEEALDHGMLVVTQAPHAIHTKCDCIAMGTLSSS